MYYKEDLGYKYPDRSDEHMISVKHLRDTHFDEHYNYLDKSLWYKFKRVILWICLNLFVFLVVTIRHGLRIYGKENMRKHKKLYKDGAITICNHVFMWDYLCVLKAIRPHLQYHPGWKINFEGPNGPLIRWVGGIPIPTGNIRAMVKFKKAIDEVLESKKWLHFFPEGSMWFYYPDIRPLKPAVFNFAVRHNKPVIPMSISFRKRKGITRLFSKKPCVDLHIGEPLLPDTSLSITESTDKMHRQAYHIMQVMNGINPGDPTYNTNQNIDEYVKTM
ncbi:MAG: 1-acyl-sn-glycerol-3-phosphate acyltransferase [Bacilli bacterium]|nr:1-acyl-sn-glycerol-3-phosphate acyltransferase [Bacilli bacterium]